MTDSLTQEKAARLVEVVSLLRQHCPWTAAQTHASLTPYALEEAQEVAEAVESLDAGAGTGSQLAGELGDLLLQVLLHAEIGSESSDPSQRLTLDDVLDALTDKLVRRSPHVFAPDGSLRVVDMSTEDIERQWDEIKARERAT